MRKLKDFPYSEAAYLGSIPLIKQVMQCINCLGIDDVNPEDIYKLLWSVKTSTSEVQTLAGYLYQFTFTGTLEDIKKAIVAGKPCIVQGCFNREAHTAIVVGYDNHGVYLSDGGKEVYLDWVSFNQQVSPESVHNPRHIYLHTFSMDKPTGIIETPTKNATSGRKPRRLKQRTKNAA